MRLPISDVYRAFPELDRFSHQQCRRFVVLAKRAHRRSELAVAVLCVPGYFAGTVAMYFLVRLMEEGFETFGIVFPRRYHDVIFLIVACAIIVVPFVAILLIRDRWLRWALNRFIGRARCDCGYSLLGLAVSDGMVVCPECGKPTVLSHRGLTPENLLVPMGDR